MDKKSTICLWVDGIGLSSSWSGNAFMSANPKNFLDMWSGYRHTTVSPCFNLKSDIENSEIDFVRVNSGENYLSDKEYLDKYIKKGELEKNEELKNILCETAKRNSSVHLVGNLPSSDEAYSSFAYLESLLKYFHSDKRIQVYIHLVLGNDLKSDHASIINYLSQYQKLIKDYPSIETASISGQDYFSDDNADKKAIQTILFGAGSPSLTLEQAFSAPKEAPLSAKVPMSIIYREKFAFKIKNFDTVLFFNHNNKHLSSFIQLLTTEMAGSLSMPKFLQIGTFFDPFYGKNKKIISMFRRKFNDNFLATLNSQCKLSVVADKAGLKNLSYSGITNDYRIIEFENYDLVAENLASLICGDNKFVLLYLNLLSKVSSANNFIEAEAVVKKFDLFLGKVMELAIKEKARTILFSSQAGLERLLSRNTIEKMSNKTIAPLPFIVVDEESEKQVSSRVVFYDMIKNRQSLVDIAPTFFDLLEINGSGLSINNSFKKEIK